MHVRSTNCSRLNCKRTAFDSFWFLSRDAPNMPFRRNCVTKSHFVGITTEETEGVEDCSFAAEPRTVSTSNMQSLETLVSEGVELDMGQYGSWMPGKQQCRGAHKWSYLTSFMAGVEILCQFKPSRHQLTPLPVESGHIS